MNILCPTDFSEHSQIAMEFAANLAHDLTATLHVITVFQQQNEASYFGRLGDLMEEKQLTNLEALAAHVSPIVKGHSPILHVYQGNEVDVILAYAKEQNIDLIVMGTQGDNSLPNLLFGSVTKKVAAKSKVPILAIPETIKHKLSSNKMLMCLDNKLLENDTIFPIVRLLADTYEQKIDVLHVMEKDALLPFDPYISAYLGEHMGEVTVKEGDDPVVEIKHFAEQHNVGLIIMIRRAKGFFTKLLTVGNTAEEIARTNIPLLILPD